MKRSKNQLILLLFTLACLIALVAIQWTWIVKQAKNQEEQFNRNVKMALEKLEKDLETFRECPAPNKMENTCGVLLNAMKQAINLDSLISQVLNHYGINLEYEYGIVNVKLNNYSSPPRGTVITANLAQSLRESGFELKINFPKRRDFILAQVGYVFVTSIILVVLVIVSFILIFSYYRRERSLSRQISEFVNNMTHEFKTPLTNIAFANSMISKSEAVKHNEKISSYTQIIKTEQTKLNERIERLLGTTSEARRENSALEPLNIVPIIEDVIETFKEQIESKKGSVVFLPFEEEIILNCLEDDLHIVLGNLLDNAIKYCHENPKIKIQIQKSERWISLEVTDNGIGISKEHQGLIFNQYFRVPTGDVHDIKGFGIGLYHVKRIIEGWGGKIEVVSAKNRGSRFILQFPRTVDK